MISQEEEVSPQYKDLYGPKTQVAGKGKTKSQNTKIFNEGISQMKMEQERLLKLMQQQADKNLLT